MKPIISVVVPVYNVEYYLDACVQSVLNQSFTNFELILVDDGSTDSSVQNAMNGKSAMAEYMLFTNQTAEYLMRETSVLFMLRGNISHY